MNLFSKNRIKTCFFIFITLDIIVLLLHLLLSKHPFLGPLFDLDREGNLPTWYSSLKFTFAAGAALLCYYVESHFSELKYSWGWIGVAVLMLGMSMDETGQIHETLINWLMAGDAGQNLRDFFHATKESGSMLWVIIFSPFLILIATAIFLYYFTRFKSSSFLLASCALSIFLLAMSGYMETLEQKIVSTPGLLSQQSWTKYHIYTTLEEVAELFAATLFIAIHYYYAITIQHKQK